MRAGVAYIIEIVVIVFHKKTTVFVGSRSYREVPSNFDGLNSPRVVEGTLLFEIGEFSWIEKSNMYTL